MTFPLRLIALLALLFPAQIAFAQSVDNPAAIAAPAIDPENIWVLELTTGGPVRILMRPDKAPETVERIRTLTRSGFYDGLTFHRVIPNFMAQGGDPNGNGTGESDLPDLKAEFNDLPHLRGTVSMARVEDPDSANSQFFIMFSPMFGLDGKYTAFGRVISGMEYVDAIHKGEPPFDPSRIVKANIEADLQGTPETDPKPADPLID